MNPNVLIYGAESTKCPSFSAALKAGHPVYTKAGSSLADGLAVPLVGSISFVFIIEEYILFKLFEQFQICLNFRLKDVGRFALRDFACKLDKPESEGWRIGGGINHLMALEYVKHCRGKLIQCV